MERPDLFPGLALYWRAFNELSTDRPLGAMGGRGPIPWTAISEWARRHHLPDGEFDDFVTLVRAADNAWLTEMAARDREAAKK